MLQVRENEISLRKTVWWFFTVANRRRNIGPHITSSDRGERAFKMMMGKIDT